MVRVIRVMTWAGMSVSTLLLLLCASLIVMGYCWPRTFHIAVNPAFWFHCKHWLGENDFLYRSDDYVRFDRSRLRFERWDIYTGYHDESQRIEWDLDRAVPAFSCLGIRQFRAAPWVITGGRGNYFRYFRPGHSVICISLWLPLFLTAMAPGWWVARALRRSFVRRKRFAKGCCPKCGYDLRATPDRCPECGQQVVANCK